MILAMLGMGALTMDYGRAYIAYHQLQSATDAAALAGAEQLPNTTAISYAQLYSASSGGMNTYNWMPQVTVTATAICSTTLQGLGLPCGGAAGGNALRVTESVTLPTYFARLFGVKTIPVITTSTAAMRGAPGVPYNIVVIVDTTQSMNTVDGSSECNTTRISCALQGVQAMLSSTNTVPCSIALGCGGSDSQSGTSALPATGNVPNGFDRIALFTFPNVETAGPKPLLNDFTCTGVNPTIPGQYQYPVSTDTSYAPVGPSGNYILGTSGTSNPAYSSTYQVVGFSTDYKTSNGATTLNPNSYLVEAVGGSSGCAPMAAPGGQGTYYAGVIYAAQAALTAEQTLYSHTQNAIVIVSDGDATSTCQQMGATSPACPSPAPSGATNLGTYPSWVNECSQAITAAQYAAAQGTRVYTVAYGAETSPCATDTSGTYANIVPCQAMKDMASDPTYFYSDYNQSGSGIDSSCIGTGDVTSNLRTIFQDIAGSLTAARLVPNGIT
jgi:Flp pilus assembly protein TadG